MGCHLGIGGVHVRFVTVWAGDPERRLSQTARRGQPPKAEKACTWAVAQRVYGNDGSRHPGRIDNNLSIKGAKRLATPTTSLVFSSAA
jgi:hypothetical protein